MKGKTVAILGFGMEGQSTLRALSPLLPDISLMVCDRNDALALQYPGALNQGGSYDHLIQWHFGTTYLDSVHLADIIIKSPGIPFRELDSKQLPGEVTSQTELFVRMYREKITGITGTKGKSTTASLLYHLLKHAGKDALLVGNIGVPPFDLMGDITENTSIVYEMSSHQLEHIKSSPSKAILLNIYQEHLDHYPNYEHYRAAKFNIARWQQAGDILVYNPEIPNMDTCLSQVHELVCKISLAKDTDDRNWIATDGDQVVCHMPGMSIDTRVDVSQRNLPGIHNLLNIGAAAAMALAAGISPDEISGAVRVFNGLAHRLEFVADIHGVRYVNDSISTIPESAMAAIEAFPDTKTIILGGLDRGIDYLPFMQYLANSSVLNMVFMGDAGKRMFDIANQQAGLQHKHVRLVKSLEEAVLWAAKTSSPGDVCLLSPAAASYNEFANFRERGNTFRELIVAMKK